MSVVEVARITEMEKKNLRIDLWRSTVYSCILQMEKLRLRKEK